MKKEKYTIKHTQEHILEKTEIDVIKQLTVKELINILKPYEKWEIEYISNNFLLQCLYEIKLNKKTKGKTK